MGLSNYQETSPSWIQMDWMGRKLHEDKETKIWNVTKKGSLTFLLASAHLELIWIYFSKAVWNSLLQSAKVPLYTSPAFDPKGKETPSAQVSSNIYGHIFHFWH